MIAKEHSVMICQKPDDGIWTSFLGLVTVERRAFGVLPEESKLLLHLPQFEN